MVIHLVITFKLHPTTLTIILSCLRSSYKGHAAADTEYDWCSFRCILCVCLSKICRGVPIGIILSCGSDRGICGRLCSLGRSSFTRLGGLWSFCVPHGSPACQAKDGYPREIHRLYSLYHQHGWLVELTVLADLRATYCEQSYGRYPSLPHVIITKH